MITSIEFSDLHFSFSNPSPHLLDYVVGLCTIYSDRKNSNNNKLSSKNSIPGKVVLEKYRRNKAFPKQTKVREFIIRPA